MIILLAGASGVGKTTLAGTYSMTNNGLVYSTSALLRNFTGIHGNSQTDLEMLYRKGVELGNSDPGWMGREIYRTHASTTLMGGMENIVVDCIRTPEQDAGFSAQFSGVGPKLLRINVVCDEDVRKWRTKDRGDGRDGEFYLFPNPDIVWDSTTVDISKILSAIAGYFHGFVDVVVGGQYGSEGKGKLVDLLAPSYNGLIRSGGPNAGHWVRKADVEFCFHQVPSGAISNRCADLFIAAGATMDVTSLYKEVRDLSMSSDNGIPGRLHIDRQAFFILDEDKTFETANLVGAVGSTASGSGLASARRLLRLGGPRGHTNFGQRGIEDCFSLADVEGIVNNRIDTQGHAFLLEGTQGSELSLYHGRYPYVTSRDTNVSGLLSEVGIAPSRVRDVWMVVRSFPIRVAGNSGPLPGEISWEELAKSIGADPERMRAREITSTTKRQRRVGMFDVGDFRKAVRINAPTRLFLTFADYLAHLDEWARWDGTWGGLPEQVVTRIAVMEQESGAPVAGVSYGSLDTDTIWKPGYGPLPARFPRGS